MADRARTWQLIHAERTALADLLDGLTPQQWTAASLCSGWTVQQAAAHVLDGAEQNSPGFFRDLARSGFRFDTMMDRGARRLGALSPAEIVARLRARTSTTNHPPPPIRVMLGEVVTHSLDIGRPLGLAATPSEPALIECLRMYQGARYPVGVTKRGTGLQLVASDLDFSAGTGPEVTGPAGSLLLALTGRPAGLAELGGDGLPVLRQRLSDRAELPT